MLRINLDGAFFTLRCAADHMVERGGGGSLVTTSSLATVMGQARGQHFCRLGGRLGHDPGGNRALRPYAGLTGQRLKSGLRFSTKAVTPSANSLPAAP